MQPGAEETRGASGGLRLSGRRGGSLAAKNVAEKWEESEVEECGQEGRHDGPHDHSVPSSAPEKFDGAPEVGVSHSVNLRNGDGEVGGTKKLFAETEEGEEAGDLNGIHEIVDNLDSGKIKPPHESNQRAECGGPA